MSANSSFYSRKNSWKIDYYYYCPIYAKYFNLDKIAERYFAMIVSDDHYSINLLSNECTSVIAKIVLAINKGVCTKYSFIDASLKSINLNNKPKLYRY